MSTGTPEASELRGRAVKRLRKKHDFHLHLLVYLIVNGLVVVTWAMTNAGFFWPIFPMVG